MSVSNGQVANQTTFNNAFPSRTVDTSLVGQVDLQNADAESGGDIFNVQRELNSESSFTGKPTNAAKDALPAWDNNDVGTGTDDLFERADALTERFNPSTGHTHDGVDSPVVSASDLSSVRLRGSFIRAGNLTGISGSTTDVSTPMSGKTPSTADTVKGVVVNPTYNKVIIRDNTAANEGDDIVNALGDMIYGRLTYLAGVWTLSFFVNVAGVETAHALSAQDVAWYYQELFNPVTDAPIYSELASVSSDNATQDVVDATATQRGLISTLAQTLAGVKSFAAGIVAQAYLALNRADVASTAFITALSTSKSFVKLTGSTATTIHGVTAGADGQTLTLHNGSSAAATIKHQSGTATAANRLKLPGATDITVDADSSIVLIYDSNQSRWVIQAVYGVATPAVTGSISPDTANNYKLVVTVAGNALTVALKTRAGADPSAGDPVYIAFRNATLATGDYVIRSVTSALSLTTGTTGDSLGAMNAIAQRDTVYAIDNAGTVALGLAGSAVFDTTQRHTSVDIAAGNSNLGNVLYSDAVYTNVAVLPLGTFVSSQATAGVWASAPTEVSLWNGEYPLEYQAATGTTKTPNGSGQFMLIASDTNSLTITPGEWEFSGGINFDSVSPPLYALGASGWYSANGANDASEPAFVTDMIAGFYSSLYPLSSASQAKISAQTIRVRATVTQKVFLVPYATMTSPTDARVTTYVYAKRIR